MTRDFRELLEAQWERGKFLCVGLDSDFEKIPEAARRRGVRETLVNFNRAVVDATKDIVCAYKPNSAFYEAHGDEGWNALRETVQYIREQAPEAPVILDGKRADIGNTNRGYIVALFGYLKLDAVTVHPYLGREALEPFLEQKGKGIIVLCRTSNHGSEEFQNLAIDGEPLYKIVARHVAREWNRNGNCGLVVGATYPEEMKAVRGVAPDLPFLVPGIGAQGGDIEKAVKAGRDARGRGIIVSSSRSIILASSGGDFAEAARRKALQLHDAIAKAV